MKLKNYEIINYFKDFKSIKIKTTEEENRKLYAVERGNSDTELLTRLFLLKRNGEIVKLFKREEIQEIIGSLRYGDYIIIRVKKNIFFSRYYVVYGNNLSELKINSEYPKEEYFSIREKPKRK